MRNSDRYGAIRGQPIAYDFKIRSVAALISYPWRMQLFPNIFGLLLWVAAMLFPFSASSEEIELRPFTIVTCHYHSRMISNARELGAPGTFEVSSQKLFEEFLTKLRAKMEEKGLQVKDVVTLTDKCIVGNIPKPLVSLNFLVFPYAWGDERVNLISIVRMHDAEPAGPTQVKGVWLNGANGDQSGAIERIMENMRKMPQTPPPTPSGG